jgi:hypothetical protein
LVGAFPRRHPKVFIRIGGLRDEETATTLIHDGHCELLFSGPSSAWLSRDACGSVSADSPATPLTC